MKAIEMGSIVVDVMAKGKTKRICILNMPLMCPSYKTICSR